MKNKIKLITVVGTRPEIIRLSCILPKFDKFFNHTLIHTNQNYDYNLNKIFFKELNLRKPDIILKKINSEPVENIANIISFTNKIIKKIKPDAFFVLGDTNSCLSAYAAKRNKIPIFHYEAGNRCFDFRVPEEINRKIIDHLADINFTYSQISKDYLIKEDFPPDQVIKIGSPIKEVYDNYKKKISQSNILKKLKIKKNNFFLISFHREENIDNEENLLKIHKLIQNVLSKYNKSIVLSLHPRTKNKISSLKLKFSKEVIVCEPFGYIDFTRLMKDSFIIISDSGTINEEASILNLKAINLRETHERPEAMENASTILSSLNNEIIINSIDLLSKESLINQIHYDYDVNDVSSKIVKNILSHIEFVNQKTWKKNK